ncbi:MAG: lysine 2,3-aminomutase [Microbacteriaceae bacterium]|jgi:lysine 2,3-aminomutase|nr:lysine 2,3-aminomutase [Microbacteriaceae bacterium]
MPKTTQRGLINSQSWDDYRWHLANRIVNVDALRDWIDVTDDEAKAIEACAGVYRWSITPYYASLMDPVDPECPVRRQAVPRMSEFEIRPGDDVDPVGDRQYRKTNRVVHKYPDRAILLVTRACPVYCRHCTRKFHTTNVDGTYFGESEALPYDEDVAYIAAHPEIRDVLLTGGDPLTYSDAKLDHLLGLLRAIPHVEILRIGTRFPVLLPQRITPAFCDMLERHHPMWVSTHFNHPKELTSEAQAACDRLLRAGAPVQNQTVLLKGINDDIDTMRALNTGLVRARVRPYYLYHCDNVTGVSHFQTSLQAGRDIMRQLEWSTTGFAVPEYVITTTIGKIRVDGDHVTEDGASLQIRNAPGETLRLDLSDAKGTD